MADRILRDLSAFYSVLQKQSFAAVHLTPSRMEDPYVELPAVQVLMEHLWNSTDPTDASGMCITMKAYRQIAPEGTENPAGYFLENYLKNFLDGLAPTPGTEDKSGEKADGWKDLRVDLLYLLTDRFAHRRAVSDFTLLAEACEIRKADVTKIESRQLDLADIQAALKPLIASKSVCSTDGLRGVRHYELGHDFMVRAVVRLWQRLAERRAEERFRYVQSQEQSRARLKGLTGIALRVRRLLIAESVLTVLSVWFLPLSWLMSRSFPDGSEIACALVCPLMLALSGVALGCWPAAIQAMVSGAGIASLGTYQSWLERDNDWSSCMMHLVVITIYLAMGTAAWPAGLSEMHGDILPWQKIAATSFDYAYILVLTGSWFLYEIWFTYTPRLDKMLILVALLWLVSQGVSILWRHASLGDALFGLRRVAEGSTKTLVWLREAIGQGTLLAFAGVRRHAIVLPCRFHVGDVPKACQRATRTAVV